MRRILSREDEEHRPHLIEYDRSSPSEKIPKRFVDYAESIQDGFSDAELAWLHDYEYFIFNTYLNGFITNAIPGLRPQKGVETQYVKRYGSGTYKNMMDQFLNHRPSSFPIEQVGMCNMPGCRMTLADGGKFYPVNYHGDIAEWRKLFSDSAVFHGTVTARFRNGKFVLSDGRKINLGDIVVSSLRSVDTYPRDW